MRLALICLTLLSAPMAMTATACQGVAVSTADEKAIIIVERTFAGTLVAINAAVDSGALRGENAAQASRLLAQAKARVDQARALYDAGQALQAQAAASTAMTTLEALAAIH